MQIEVKGRNVSVTEDFREITGWIVGQAIVNVGAVTGALPVTGVPLPFISFGGSALLFTMCATGVLLNVARQGR